MALPNQAPPEWFSSLLPGSNTGVGVDIRRRAVASRQWIEDVAQDRNRHSCTRPYETRVELRRREQNQRARRFGAALLQYSSGGSDKTLVLLVQPSPKPTNTDIDRASQRFPADDSLPFDQFGPSVKLRGQGGSQRYYHVGHRAVNAVLDVASVPGVVEGDDQLAVQRRPTEVKTASKVSCYGTRW